MERVQESGSTFLTGSVVRGRFALRACVLHYATETADLDALLADVRQAASSTDT